MNIGFRLLLPSAPTNPLLLFLSREWNFDLKKLPNIKMRKLCSNDAVLKKCKKKTVITVDTHLGELELNDESNDSDEEMTAVA